MHPATCQKKLVNQGLANGPRFRCIGLTLAIILGFKAIHNLCSLGINNFGL
jgi:hypothetical protein